MMTRLELTRNVTKVECPWLDFDSLNKGSVVYKFNGITYGCVSQNGVACSFVEDEYPFFELPRDAVKEL